jgi:two-component system response regulator HydG
MLQRMFFFQHDSRNVRLLQNKKLQGEGKTTTILVVDYDRSTLRVFKLLLKRRGFTVDAAQTGDEAKEKMKRNTYDATLISFNLPDMDGIDLLLFVSKSMPNAAKIISTGFPSLGNSIKAIEAGADAYFCKPVDPEQFAIVVENKLEQAGKGKTPSDTVKSPSAT